MAGGGRREVQDSFTRKLPINIVTRLLKIFETGNDELVKLIK